MNPAVKDKALSDGFTLEVAFDDQSTRYYKVLENHREQHYLPHWTARRSCLEHDGMLPTGLTKSQAAKLAQQLGVDILPVGLYGPFLDQVNDESVLLWNDGMEIFRGNDLLEQCASDFITFPFKFDDQKYQAGGGFFNGGMFPSNHSSKSKCPVICL